MKDCDFFTLPFNLYAKDFTQQTEKVIQYALVDDGFYAEMV